MKGKLSKILPKNISHLTSVFIVVFLLVLFIYLNIMVMRDSPMGQTTWEFTDPAPSFMNFAPGIMYYDMRF